MNLETALNKDSMKSEEYGKIKRFITEIIKKRYVNLRCYEFMAGGIEAGDLPGSCFRRELEIEYRFNP